MKFKHLVMTRFNVHAVRNMGEEKAKIWQDKRIELFNKYCLPSIKNQTCQNFTWIIFIDENSEELDIFNYENIIVERYIIREGWTLDTHPFVVTARKYCDDIDYLITTRFDSDDCINTTMIEKIQDIGKNTNCPTVVNFIGGCKIDSSNNKVAKCNFKGPNMFISYIENADNPYTVYRDTHSNMKKHGEVINIKDDFMCGMVCHSDNISNKFNHSDRKIYDWDDIKHNFGG